MYYSRMDTHDMVLEYYGEATELTTGLGRFDTEQARAVHIPRVQSVLGCAVSLWVPTDLVGTDT